MSAAAAAAASASASAAAMKVEEEVGVVPLIISGYRFLPTDLELVRDYLCKKITNQKLPSDVPVVEYDIYSTEPWNLPVNNIIDTINNNRSYYFVKLMDGTDRRYRKRIVLNHSNSDDDDHNGVEVVGGTRRSGGGGGYWKKIAGGRDTRYIRDELYKSIGVKKSFAFHAYLSSPAPRHMNSSTLAGTAMTTWKTNWIMDEYSLNSQRTQPWVLCILRKKGGGEEEEDDDIDEVELLSKLKQIKQQQQQQQQQQPAAIINHVFPERELNTLEKMKTIQERIKTNQIQIWDDQKQLRFLNGIHIMFRQLKQLDISVVRDKRSVQTENAYWKDKIITNEEAKRLKKQLWEEYGRKKAEIEAEIAVIQAGSYYVVQLPSRFQKRRRKN